MPDASATLPEAKTWESGGWNAERQLLRRETCYAELKTWRRGGDEGGQRLTEGRRDRLRRSRRCCRRTKKKQSWKPFPFSASSVPLAQPSTTGGTLALSVFLSLRKLCDCGRKGKRETTAGATGFRRGRGCCGEVAEVKPSTPPLQDHAMESGARPGVRGNTLAALGVSSNDCQLEIRAPGPHRQGSTTARGQPFRWRGEHLSKSISLLSPTAVACSDSAWLRAGPTGGPTLPGDG